MNKASKMKRNKGSTKNKGDTNNTSSTRKTIMKIFLVVLTLIVLGVAYALATLEYGQFVKCGIARAARMTDGVIRITTGAIIIFAGFLQLTLGTFITLLAVVFSLGLGVIVYTLHLIFGSLFDFAPLMDNLEWFVQLIASQKGQDGIFKAIFSIPVTPLVALSEQVEAIANAGC
jgi:hypothetical protein